jgi:hypothetical protein
MRVYHRLDEEMGSYEVNLEDLKHPFRDARKGLFVPFEGDNNTRYYAMVLRKLRQPIVPEYAVVEDPE